jgi:hypothetical protein
VVRGRRGAADPSVLRKYTSYLKDGEASNARLNYAVYRQHSGRIGRFHMPDPGAATCALNEVTHAAPAGHRSAEGRCEGSAAATSPWSKRKGSKGAARSQKREPKLTTEN